MSDIVERLRARAKANAAGLRSISNGVEIGRPDHRKFIAWEAADTIEALRARLLAAEKALDEGLRFITDIDNSHSSVRLIRASLSTLRAQGITKPDDGRDVE